MSSLLHQAENYHQKGLFDEAQELYKSHLKKFPDDVDALYGLGTLHLQKKEFKLSKGLLLKAIELQPNSSEIRFNFGQLLVFTNNGQKAREQFLTAASLTNDEPTLYSVCQSLQELKYYSEAINILDRINIKALRTQYLYAKLKSLTGQIAQARKLFQELTTSYPNEAIFIKELSVIAANERKYGLAEEYYIEFLNKSPYSHENQIAYADLLLMAKKVVDASHVINEVIKSGAKSAQAYIISGRCARYQGHTIDACKSAKDALSINPHLGDPWYLLSELAPKIEIPDLLSKLEFILNNSSCQPYDFILMHFSLAKMHEILEQNDQAFLLYKKANEIQNKELVQNGKCYNEATESLLYERTLELFQKLPPYKPKSTGNTPIFILGLPRSGTTLVEKILSCIEGVEAGGENDTIEHIAATYFSAVKNGQLPKPSETPEDIWHSLEQEYWSRTNINSNYLTDKMPHNFRHIGLIANIFPSAPIIFIKRDPRDVCLSIYTRYFSDVHSYSTDWESLVDFYSLSEKLINYWQSIDPDRVLVVDYENIINDFEKETKRITSYCGLQWNKDCLNFHEKKSSSFTFSELQVREPINKEGLNRWKKYEPYLSDLVNALQKI